MLFGVKDGLRGVVLGEVEVFWLEAVDGVAALVVGYDVDRY
jgi:hypothetical protein